MAFFADLQTGLAIRTPIRAPKANAYAERWVPTVRAECLDWMLVLGRRHLLWILRAYVRHYNQQRPHRGLALAVPEPEEPSSTFLSLERSGAATCSAASSMSITRSQHDESGFPRPTGRPGRPSPPPRRHSPASTASWWWMPYVLVFGIVTGWLRERTGSVAAGFVAHVLNAMLVTMTLLLSG
jgi:hypothetical protein